MEEGPVAGQPRDRWVRAAELERRLAEIERRLAELRPRPARPGHSAAVELVETVQRHARDANRRWQEQVTQTLQVRQLVVQALRNAARAHERAAEANERSVRAGIGDVAEYRRRAEFHRAAAAADQQQAEQIQAQDTQPETPR